MRLKAARPATERTATAALVAEVLYGASPRPLPASVADALARLEAARRAPLARAAHE